MHAFKLFVHNMQTKTIQVTLTAIQVKKNEILLGHFFNYFIMSIIDNNLLFFV